tara:strand:+ start:1924 stop:2481 length:558 start_codon:yes stop_codon:yes gene_type:complete
MSNYINNEDFLIAMIEYKEQIKIAEENNEERPPVPEYIGECFLLIAERLSYRPNFINYAFKDDMISDGIENCLQYVHNFNPEKSKNPFAYFTQIIYWAFVRRIQKEKKNLYVKYKEMERLSYLNDHVDKIDDQDEYMTTVGSADMRNMISEFIEDFEEKRIKKKKKKKELNLERTVFDYENSTNN